jgi:hypothetical protein
VQPLSIRVQEDDRWNHVMMSYDFQEKQTVLVFRYQISGNSILLRHKYKEVQLTLKKEDIDHTNIPVKEHISPMVAKPNFLH